jgi:L-threonylcarbamoyladenylate synthase
MIIDGGRATLGLESTIVDLTGKIPMILRPGCITKAMLENVVGSIEYDPVILAKKPNMNLVPKAPGMKYRHYAPEGSLTIYSGKTNAVIKAINSKAKEQYDSGKSVGIIATEETKEFYHYGIIKTIGTRKDEATIAAGLYDILREFDELHTEYIFTESFADNSLGQAIMNRLLKAAGYRMIEVTD